MLRISRSVSFRTCSFLILAIIGLLFVSCTNAGFEVVNDDIGAVRVSLSNDEKAALCGGRKRRKNGQKKKHVERKVEESVQQGSEESSQEEPTDSNEGRN